MKHYLTFFCPVAIADLVYSQKEGNIGIFGTGVGLNFNTSPPEVFVLASEDFRSEEACASISDKNGNLLFYTNGHQVFNREHKIMPNGERIGLDFQTTTQTAIVPIPKSSFLYYIFSPDYQGRDLKFSLVDMRMNEGLGGVVFKNITEEVPYWITVANKCQSVSDTIHVRYLNNKSLFIPNVITSNGDNMNDSFILDSRSAAYPSVYNRWGDQVVYHREDYGNEWRGYELDPGITTIVSPTVVLKKRLRDGCA